MFKLNLKIALRNLWKSKGFSLINIGGLSIGLASCMILLLYVAYEWGYDKHYTNYEKIYMVYNNQTTPTQVFSFAATPGLLAEEAKAKVPGIALASRVDYQSENLISYNQNGLKRMSSFADPEYFKIFDHKVLKGNKEQFLKNPNSVILTKTLADQLFPNADPINKVVKFSGKEELKVEGVIEDLPENSSVTFDFLMPWALYEKINPWSKEAGWQSNFCMTIVQLRDNSAFESANGMMKGLIKANNKDSNGEPFLHPLTSWHLFSKFEGGKSVGGEIDQLRIFFLLAFCILLIACVNFMNLSTARSEKRAKEVGVRKAIGSTRKALISQFMLESMLIGFISMFVAFVLIEVSLPYFNRVIDINLSIDYQDWKFWATLVSLTAITGFIAGSYPAFYLSSFSPIKVLKGFTIPGSSSLSIRKGLVVFQFVFAACLIVCTAVIYQQLNFIKNKPIGFDKANVVQVPMKGNFEAPENRALLKDLLLRSGAVVAAAEYSTPFTRGGNNTYGISWPGKAEKDMILVNHRYTTYDLVKTTQMELIDGRDFEPGRPDSLSVLVNQTLANIMGMKDPVGKQIGWGDSKVTIVGLMKDYVMESPFQTAKPLIVGFNKWATSTMILRLDPARSVTASLAQVDKILKAQNPEFPVDRTFLSDSFEQKFVSEKRLGILSNWFGGFAIFICCLGLLGLALYMAEQRKKEISIRKVLGASTTNILTLLNKDFIKLVLAANLIAFPLAYIIINNWLSNYEYRVGLSVLPFAIAIGLSLLIAILTVSVQSVKVAKANPVDALKYE